MDPVLPRLHPPEETLFCPSQKGVVTALFQNSHEADPDPNKSLQALIENRDIIQYRGNAFVKQSQIVFLDATNHLDKSQTSIHGQIFNALKNKGINVCLREAADSDKMSTSADEKFPPNLDETDAKVYYSGWDNMLLHQESKKALFQWFKLRESLGLAFADDVEIARIKKEIKNIKNSIREKAHLRTESMWKTINKFLSLYPEAKIFIFAGSGHNHEEWLQERLLECNYSYCILTPKENEVPNASEEFRKYHHR